MKPAWQELNDRLIGSPSYFELDTHVQTHYRTLSRLATRYLGGVVLDAGAGRLTHRSIASSPSISRTRNAARSRSGSATPAAPTGWRP